MRKAIIALCLLTFGCVEEDRVYQHVLTITFMSGKVKQVVYKNQYAFRNNPILDEGCFQVDEVGSWCGVESVTESKPKRIK